MGFYSRRGNPVYETIGLLTIHRFNVMPRLDDGLLKAAGIETTKIKAKLDSSTFPFHQDLVTEVFGNSPTRVILVDKGTLYGVQSIDTVIGIDLGNNPYPLFKPANNGATIDAEVTDSKTREFLDSINPKDLPERERNIWQGLDGFLRGISIFYYFKEGDISSRFLTRDGEIDMAKILPLVTEIPFSEAEGKIQRMGHVFLSPKGPPSFQEYQENFIPFVSYRLKNSLAEKIEGVLAQQSIKTDDVIGDWVGHRAVRPRIGDVYELKEFFALSQDIGLHGKSKVELLRTKDYYSDWKLYNKMQAFGSVNLVLQVDRGRQTSVRGLQITDEESYYQNEIDPRSPIHHRKYRNKQRQSAGYKYMRKKFDPILNPMFGSPTNWIPIRH